MNIKSSTFQFLSELRENNSREWFQLHKEAYEEANTNVKAFVEDLIQKLATFDNHIHTDIKASKCMFRIYRDVRFSKDKVLYKTWLSAGISEEGRKLDGPEYYIHIEPGKSFAAVGYWQPKKEHLEAIRQELDYNFDRFIALLNKDGWTLDDLSIEDKLKRPPAGYEATNPAIEVIKLKSFVLLKHFSDQEMSRSFASEHIVEMFQRTLGFKEFLHEAIDAI